MTLAVETTETAIARINAELASWESGPDAMRWNGEPVDEPAPDLITKNAMFTWTYSGLQCALIWNDGYYGGYVRLPHGHPLRGTDVKPLGNELKAPGGLTYGADAHGWIGFDTNHYWMAGWGIERTVFDVEKLATRLA